jgi:hypothetical protein
LIGTVLGGLAGFWVAEQLAVGYRVRSSGGGIGGGRHAAAAFAHTPI